MHTKYTNLTQGIWMDAIKIMINDKSIMCACSPLPRPNSAITLQLAGSALNRWRIHYSLFFIISSLPPLPPPLILLLHPNIPVLPAPPPPPPPVCHLCGAVSSVSHT